MGLSPLCDPSTCIGRLYAFKSKKFQTKALEIYTLHTLLRQDRKYTYYEITVLVEGMIARVAISAAIFVVNRIIVLFLKFYLVHKLYTILYSLIFYHFLVNNQILQSYHFITTVC